MTDKHNANAWGLPQVLDYFASARSTTDMVYPSEWFFLRDLLSEGMSVLDVGCAQGGFAGVLKEHLTDFDYTGIDISPEMISLAREKHPDRTFHVVAESDFSVLDEARYDLVLVLGILHLHETWRDSLSGSWAHTCGHMVFDLRETPQQTIEDKAISYHRMDFHGGGKDHENTHIPYNVINAAEALGTVVETCAGARRISHYGYFHPVTSVAVCPYDPVMVNTYCIQR